MGFAPICARILHALERTDIHAVGLAGLATAFGRPCMSECIEDHAVGGCRSAMQLKEPGTMLSQTLKVLFQTAFVLACQFVYIAPWQQAIRASRLRGLRRSPCLCWRQLSRKIHVLSSLTGMQQGSLRSRRRSKKRGVAVASCSFPDNRL